MAIVKPTATSVAQTRPGVLMSTPTFALLCQIRQQDRGKGKVANVSAVKIAAAYERPDVFLSVNRMIPYRGLQQRGDFVLHRFPPLMLDRGFATRKQGEQCFENSFPSYLDIKFASQHS